MKFPTRSAVAVATVALVSACASTGGSGSGQGGGSSRQGSSTGADPLTGLICAAGALFGARCSAPTPAPPPPVPFTRWSDHQVQGSANVTVAVTGPRVLVGYWRDPIAKAVAYTEEPYFSARADSYEKFANFYDGAIHILHFESGEADLIADDSALQGQPAIEVLQGVGIAANPYALGWGYQSFGAWDETSVVKKTQLGATSFGAATPGNMIPASGSATFAGKLAGMYFDTAGQRSFAAANLDVQVDFSQRRLDLASTGTSLERGALSAPAPHLDVSGALTYAPGSGSFTGTLANAGGTMSGTSNGQFYGPTAEELGGVFALKSATTVETFVGAYGAKR